MDREREREREGERDSTNVDAAASRGLKKGFKILDLGSPINIISHYGARTFEYNLDLNNIVSITSF